MNELAVGVWRLTTHLKIQSYRTSYDFFEEQFGFVSTEGVNQAPRSN